MTREEGYDAVVIGAGPNGLICAAYLARAGHRVLLLERRHETGGGLNTDEYFGFRLNLHAVYHMMSDVMPAHADLDLANRGVRYLYPDVAAAFPFRDGSSLVLSRDPGQTAASIAALCPDDASAFQRMWDDFQPMLEQYLIPMTYELPEPALDQMVEFGETPVGQRLAEISELSFVEMLDEYGIRDPRVRMALLSFPAMWGMHLDDPLGYLYPLYLCRMLSAGLVKGGSHRLSSAIYRSFLRDGGTVLDACEATRIVTQEGAAVGVETADGRRFEARAVVSTLNPEQTFFELIDAEALPENLRRAAESWEWEERSMFGLHLGIRGGVSFRAADPRVGEAMIVFCGLETEDELFDHLERVDAGGVDTCEWLHVTHASRFDATMAPAGHDLLRAEAVVKYDPAWQTEAKAFADGCVRLLQEYAQIGDIVFRRHYTPLDIEAKLTTMKRGSIKHGAYTPLQMGYLRPNDLCSHSETPIPGLFVGGASMYPGGMILGGPGYIAAGVVGEYLGGESVR
ncbi:MAG: NAD(P)/FAD-dependent oxidoreductase [Deltaproteobacteria bacterium]|nr:MAG: NAD(P)/FAD-dependent oxidoreductase [Deltaproteobacteria bacterium]